MKLVTNHLILLTAILLLINCTSCIEKKSQTATNQGISNNTSSKKVHTQKENSSSEMATIKKPSTKVDAIDANGFYFVELQKFLGLSSDEISRIKSISEKYKTKIANVRGNAVQLKQVQGQKAKEIASVLSPAQIELKKYVDAVMFKTNPKSEIHPLSVKKRLALSDKQVHGWLVSQAKYKENKQGLSDKQAKEQLKIRNAKLKSIFTPQQFFEFREIMADAYNLKFEE